MSSPQTEEPTFESNLFFFSLQALRCTPNPDYTSYHPISNGLVERMHRQLKAASSAMLQIDGQILSLQFS
ncbi:hypothetical protein JTE90_012176 [Oedothorax gibbosus]|uniref:Integrase catalytic domain-containing protein n=1 Tax=Oedothorax gibbosus TaxID=931172 RepID=A0AAV6TNC9_9ARAC|nr:hypothetical protein JTE90_012176 [Oedothorax gibbosus]